MRVGLIGITQEVIETHVPLLQAMGAHIAWLCDDDTKWQDEAATIAAFHICRTEEAIEKLPDADVIFIGQKLAFTADAARRLADRNVLFVIPPSLAMPAQKTLICNPLRAYAATDLLQQQITQKPFGALRQLTLCQGLRMRATGHSNLYEASTQEGGGITQLELTQLLDTALHLTQAQTCTLRDCQLEWDQLTDRQAQAHFTLRSADDTSCELHLQASWLQPMRNEIICEFEHARITLSLNTVHTLHLTSHHAVPLGEIKPTISSGPTDAMQANALLWHAARDTLRSHSMPIQWAPHAQCLPCIQTLLEAGAI